MSSRREQVRSERARLDAVRRVWADRADAAHTTTDTAYVVYLVVLSVGLIGVPLGLGLATALARPEVLPLVTAATRGTRALGGLLALAAAGVVAGSVLGPAVLSPFLTAVLAGSDLPRRRTLGRPLARSLALVGLVGVVLGALLGAVVRTGGVHAAAGPVVLGIAGGSLAAVLVLAWLLGMVLGARPRTLLAILLALAGAVLLLLPAGAPQTLGPLLAGALVLLALAAVGAGVLLLERIPSAVLRAQAARQENATVIATSGDLGGAAAEFRPLPTTGRRLSAVGASSLFPSLGVNGRDLLLYLRRDAIGWLRTPGRSVLGVLGALAGGALLALACGTSGVPGALCCAAGTLLLWSASSAVVDGLRHGIETLGAPTLFGHGLRRQLLLHIPAPAALLAALGGIGAAITGLGTVAVLVPMLLGVLCVIERVWASAKGPMPLWISTPMPTAQGDASLIPQLLWHGDAIWCVLIAGFALVAAQSSGLGPLALTAAIIAAVLGLLVRRRIRLLR